MLAKNFHYSSGIPALSPTESGQGKGIAFLRRAAMIYLKQKISLLSMKCYRTDSEGSTKSSQIAGAHSLHRRPAAFSILEVLVASAIMGIVMFVLVSTANTTLQLWRVSSEKIAVDREGRSGLALLAWDLQNIVQPTNLALRPWIYTNIVVNGSAPIPILSFLTRKPADYQHPSDDLGDVCYVEYRYTNYSITRAFVGSSNTFSAIRSGAFPTNFATNFETLATNVWRIKLWGLPSTNANIAYGSTGQQSAAGESLRAIEYRLGILDGKYMKLYSAPNGDKLAAAQNFQSLRWYQGIQPVSPPTQ
jgi:hypothetical protein